MNRETIEELGKSAAALAHSRNMPVSTPHGLARAAARLSIKPGNGQTPYRFGRKVTPAKPEEEEGAEDAQ